MQPLTSVRINGKTLIREGGGFDDGATHVQTVARNKYVDALYYERPYTVTYNFGTVTTVFQHVEAFTTTVLPSSNFPVSNTPKSKTTAALRHCPIKKISTEATANTFFPHRDGKIQIVCPQREKKQYSGDRDRLKPVRFSKRRSGAGNDVFLICAFLSPRQKAQRKPVALFRRSENNQTTFSKNAAVAAICLANGTVAKINRHRLPLLQTPKKDG